MMNIPMDLLRTFCKTVEVGSFTRAAEAVGRTQSAVSLQIRRLEDLLDAPLIVRGSHRVRLTEPGSVLLEYGRRILALNDEVVGSLVRPKVAGCVRLGAPHEYTASLLPAILGKFAQAHPNVMLEVTCDLSKNLLTRMAEGEFDLVVALHDGPGDGSGTKVITEPLVWVTSQDHARHEELPVSLVVAPSPCIYRSRALLHLNRLAKPWKITYSSSSYSGITAAVRAGLGVTVLAESTVPDGVRRLGAREGFPDLGSLDVRLHMTDASPGEAVLRLSDYIAHGLA